MEITQKGRLGVVEGFAAKAALFSLPVLFLASCTSGPATDNKLYHIPWPDENNQYQLQDVSIQTFRSADHLSGDYVQFFLKPNLSFDRHDMDQDGTPTGKFATADSGSLVALDFLSLQAATVYAHYERLHLLDNELGLGDVLATQTKIALEVDMIDENSKSIENNAQYSGTLDAIMFEPYTDSNLPLTLNAGVIAHEHFHSIFQHKVLSTYQDASLALVLAEPKRSPATDKALSDSEQQVGADSSLPRSSIKNEIKPADYNRIVLRGINEGLADFWAWIYTGDTNFVGRSLTYAAKGRNLEQKNLKVYDLSTFAELLVYDKTEDVRIARAYVLGTQYAVNLRNLALQVSGGRQAYTDRAVWAHVLLAALDKFHTEVSATSDTSYLPPEIFLKHFLSSMPVNTLDVCQSFKGVAPLAQASSAPQGCDGGGLK